MKLTLILCIFFLLSNCSLNKGSKYWTKDFTKNIKDQKNLLKILEKSSDVSNMTLKEYEIYIDDHTKRSKYPDIN